MGTRHLVAVVLNGEVKVAQYGQWDGYPSGQGETVVKFISRTMRIRKFKEQVAKCTFLTKEQIFQTWKEFGADESGFVSMDISRKHAEKYPALSRDVGAEILKLVQSGKGRKLDNAIEFAADSLFCEFAYVLDLDGKVLEFYKGFNYETPKGRFATMPKCKYNGEEKEYFPVTLLATIPFKECNSKTTAKLERLVNRAYNKQEKQRVAKKVAVEVTT